MAAPWLVVVLLLVPGVATAQAPAPIVRPTVAAPTVTGTTILVDPRTPPPPTIPTAPDVALPLPLPTDPAARPTRILDLRPTVTLSEEYTDNFNRSRRDPVSNFRTSLSPGLLVLFERGFLSGQAAYTPTVFHDTAVDDTGVRHNFAGRLAWQVTPRFRLSAADTLVQSDNPVLADRLTLRRGREEFTSNQFTLTGEYSLPLLDTEGSYRLSTFSSDTSKTTSNILGLSGSKPLGRIHRATLGYEYLDSETIVKRPDALLFTGATADSTTTGHQVTGSFSRELTRNTTAGLTATYAVREQRTAGRTTDFTRWSLSFFNNYVVADRIVLRGSLGVAQLDSDAGRARLVVISNTDFTYYLGAAIFGLRIERGFSETFAEGQNFGVVETSGATGSVTYRFTPLLTGAVSGTYRENKFTGTGGGGQSGRDDTSFGGSANLSYQVLRWLTATMDYSYTETTSSLPQAGFIENRVRAALTASFH
jgi:hypothetical protein